VTGYFSYTGEDKQPAPSRKDKMRKFFLIQTGIILLLIYPDGVIKLSIFIFPIYYVAQLMGWLYDQGIIGG